MSETEGPLFEDDDTVGWVYANDLGAVAFDGTTVRIEFDVVSPPRSAGAGGDGRSRRRPVIRLVLTPAATQQLAAKLGELRSAIAARRARPKVQVLN